MSKTLVGDVYSKVIDEVCAASRVDFEESGVEHGTLDLLKQLWQKKLSGLNVAQLPWDPRPDAVQSTLQTTKPPASLPSNGHLNNSQSATAVAGPQIKQEPQQYPAPQPGNPAPYNPPQGGPMNASQRAAMHLHQKYGNQAGHQIAQLQQTTAQSRFPAGQSAQQQSGNYIKREDGGSDISTVQDFKVDATQNTALKTLQTDGASDEYESEIAQRRAAIAQYKQEGDRLMRSHFLAGQRNLEGGGLLIPLNERLSATRAIDRYDAGLSGEGYESLAQPHGLDGGQNRQSSLPLTRLTAESATGTSAGQSLRRAQGDAAADDEDDEDAINSDLDDPDELENPDEQEENVHEVMLCTYDKVQRVKNKWKCTLKDGILRVDQQEYVFHKGQGEFEW